MANGKCIAEVTTSFTCTLKKKRMIQTVTSFIEDLDWAERKSLAEDRRNESNRNQNNECKSSSDDESSEDEDENIDCSPVKYVNENKKNDEGNDNNQFNNEDDESSEDEETNEDCSPVKYMNDDKKKNEENNNNQFNNEDDESSEDEETNEDCSPVKYMNDDKRNYRENNNNQFNNEDDESSEDEITNEDFSPVKYVIENKGNKEDKNNHLDDKELIEGTNDYESCENEEENEDCSPVESVIQDKRNEKENNYQFKDEEMIDGTSEDENREDQDENRDCFQVKKIKEDKGNEEENYNQLKDEGMFVDTSEDGSSEDEDTNEDFSPVSSEDEDTNEDFSPVKYVNEDKRNHEDNNNNQLNDEEMIEGTSADESSEDENTNEDFSPVKYVNKDKRNHEDKNNNQLNDEEMIEGTSEDESSEDENTNEDFSPVKYVIEDKGNNGENKNYQLNGEEISEDDHDDESNEEILISDEMIEHKSEKNVEDMYLDENKGCNKLHNVEENRRKFEENEDHSSEEEIIEDSEDDSLKDPNFICTDTDDDDSSEEEIIEDNIMDLESNFIEEECEDGNEDALSEVLDLQESWTEKTVSELADEVLAPEYIATKIDLVQANENSPNSSEVYDYNNLTEMPATREKPLNVEECLFDQKYPNVYVKAFKKQNMNSKHNRQYDTVHACLYCHRLFTNIGSHMDRKHANKDEMKEISKLRNSLESETDKDIKKMKGKLLKNKLTMVRNRGDNLHNQKVRTHMSGEILLARRKKGKFIFDEYGPCPNCEEWIDLKMSITNHQITCSAKSEDQYNKGSTIITAYLMMGKVTQTGSKMLMTEVFPSMKRDEIASLALGDPLIVALGDIWLMKNIDNKRKRKYYSSFHMRLAARLLDSFNRSEGKTATMSEMLNVIYFDKIASTALNICSRNKDDTSSLDNPSTAIKCGFDIMRMTSAKLGTALKAGDQIQRQEAKDLMNLMKMEWNVKVSKLARSVLNERQFNRKKELPHPADIAELSSYLITELDNLDLTKADTETFRNTVMLVQSRLLLYNRRRPGELEALSIDGYNRRSSSVSETDLSLREHLTDVEKEMLWSQELIEIRGKNGTRVPVLCPREVQLGMQYLANVQIRQMVGIKEDNSYLFANTALDVVRAGESLDTIKRRCNLKFPERIYATNLRKYCATIAQVIGLKDHELKYLCRHMGHTMDVHETHYKSTSGLIERLDIAKLMLIQEGNLVGKFQGKSFREIKFEEILQKDNVSDLPGFTNLEECSPTSSLEQPTSVNGMDFEMLTTDDGNDHLCTRKKTKQSNRVRWSEEETKELYQYFQSYFNGKERKTCPSRKDCLEAIIRSRSNGGKIQSRKWETIKKKVSNMLKKN